MPRPQLLQSDRVVILIALCIGLASCSRTPAPPPDGAALFVQKCASCHKAENDMYAPPPETLHEMSKPAILAALQTGRMKWEGKFLSQAKKNAIADYLAAPNPNPTIAATAYCARDLDPPANLPTWTGWGADLHNRRFQSTPAAGLTAADVPNLKLKWAFGFPGAAATYGQPTAFAGRVFVGSEDGTVYSLDSATGCLWWTFKASATVKTAISVGNHGTAAFFGDTNGIVYAVKVSDGSLIWKAHPELHSAARITGSPLLVNTRLYVPISSGEEGASADPDYPCCTFRGSVVALDTETGKQIWKTYTITDLPQPTRKNANGVQYYGPSGAAVWSTPSADVRRRVLYVTTGNNYSNPPTANSDAVMAFNLDTGKKLWSQQLGPKDVWNSGCVAPKKDNCPDNRGDDHDFGAPPLLESVGGRDILLAAQKSGVIYSLDPDNRGKILWNTRIGHGGPLGGIEWGGASDHRYAFFPLSDFDFDNAAVGGGVFALDLRTGRQVWHVAPETPACLGQFGCSPAQMAPPTAIPGVVFVGSLDGHLRAHDSRTGRVLWDFNTAQQFHTTDGVKAHGGSLNGAGPAIVNGMVYVNTGYTNAMDGNVLLAFAPEK
ncbi:MAG: PQQ-binding-like beta-propeller repeat protein [Candidatus Sulfotelmatobacter sp.]